MTSNQSGEDKSLPFWLAAAPFVLLIVLFASGTLYMNAGESLIVLSMLGAATFASAIAVRQGKGWNDIQQSAIDKIASVFPVILILLSIGALIGAWVFSGTIPMIVWVGLQIINPAYIVVTAFFAAALMSIVTGTSWGSAGTIGVALMGIATVIDAPLPIVAGAIVSGAYFGDKMSPLSDSTNIAALGAGADLYGHIRHMTYTAFPSFVVATLVFTFVQTGNGQPGGALSEAANVMIRDIEMVFRLEWFALLPTVVIFFAIARKWPPVLGIVAAAASGAVIGILGQGFDINDGLLALTTGFNVEMIHTADAGSLSEPFLQLVNRGGVYSIVNTLVVIIAAFILAGAMDASGALKILVNGLLQSAKSVFSLVATTMASSLVMLSLTSHGGVTCLIVGGLYQDAYKERKLAPVNLSRSLEDSVTLMDPLMPWTVSALFMANTLGVPTLSYFPWAIFCLGGPVFSMLLAAQYGRTGFGLKPLQSTPSS